jgi:integrase
MAKKDELPKDLKGSWAWKNEEKKIRWYRLRYKDSQGKSHALAVVQMRGEDIDGMRERMKAKEKAIENAIAESYKHSSDNPSVTLVDAVRGYIDSQIVNNKENSQDRIISTLNNQIDKHPIGIMRVADITEDNIKNYFSELQEDKSRTGKPLSYSAIKKAYLLLNKFFKYYYKNDINNNPMNGISCPKKSSLPDAEENKFDDTIVLSDEEIELYKKECYKPPEAGKRGSKYDLATYFIMLMCLRVGEALALRWKDIDFKSKKVTISKSIARVKTRDSDAKNKTELVERVPKTANSIRTIFMNDEALQTIIDYKAVCKYTSQNDYAFSTEKGNSAPENKIWLVVKNLIKNAGLNEDGKRDKFNVHYLRHTGISFYIRHGIDVSIVSRMAGHASVAITQNVYYHVIADQQKEGMDAMNAIFAKHKQSAAGTNTTDGKV